MSRRQKPQNTSAAVEWDFRSFPVAFAFAVGAFTATLLLLATNSAIIDILWVVTLFGVSFGVAHITTHYFRRRNQDKQRTREQEEERERRVLAARAARHTPTADGEAVAPAAPPAPQRRRRKRRG